MSAGNGKVVPPGSEWYARARRGESTSEQQAFDSGFRLSRERRPSPQQVNGAWSAGILPARNAAARRRRREPPGRALPLPGRWPSVERR